MKKCTFRFLFFLPFLIHLPSLFFAQTTAVWQGGKPGRITDWECAANWKEGKVPDQFSLVIIPSDRLFYPKLRNEAYEIDALLVEGGAKLTFESGSSLTITGETGRMEKMTLLGTIITEYGWEINHLDTLYRSFRRQSLNDLLVIGGCTGIWASIFSPKK
ncbi:MAG TPA: hypothetical protein PKC40_05170 [Saprospiraceae bacterium]|nr:hypothetical protein [Saprospiraceae bacterium]